MERVLIRLTDSVSISKYIKNLFGLKVHVEIKEFLKGCDAFADHEHTTITFGKKSLEDQAHLRYLIFHEVGHLVNWKKDAINAEDEYLATVFALESMKDRGYRNLYEAALKHVRVWATDKCETGEDRIYRMAAKRALKKMRRSVK